MSITSIRSIRVELFRHFVANFIYVTILSHHFFGIRSRNFDSAASRQGYGFKLNITSDYLVV